MADTIATSPARKKRRGWRILVLVVAVIIVLIIAAFFIITSTGFFKSVILPRVGKSLNSDITVSDASIHIFSAVTLRDLKVTPNGAETLLTAPEVRAHYGLWQIIRGNIKISEVAIVSPTIHVVEKPDGSSNLDPLMKALTKEPKEKKKPEKPSKPARIELDNLTVSNATVIQEKLYAGANRDVLEVSNANFTLSNLKNGASGKITVSAGILVQKNPPAPGTNGVLQATLNGSYGFAMSADLKPQSIQGLSQLTVTRAEGSLNDLAACVAKLNCDVAPAEIKQVALQFQKNGEVLGEIHASGPLDMEKMEGRVQVELSSLDKRALNLIGASSGVDFGTTTINSTNTIQLAQGGSMITAAGQLNANKVQLIHDNETTPTLDLHANYDISVNRAASNALLRTFTLNGTQNGQPLLRGELSSPMNIAWGNPANAVGDSTLNLTLTNLNLANWKSVLGNSISEGRVEANLKVLSQKAGKHLTLNLDSHLANIAPIGGDKTLASAAIGGNISVQLNADSKDIKGVLSVSNAVIHDPSGEIPSTPLEASLQLDTTLSPNLVDLRQLQIALTPTDRAKNQVLVQGRVNTADTNATAGNLKLTSDALDLTRYYELFTATTNVAPTTVSETPANPVPVKSSNPNEEPAAIKLPFGKFIVEANVGAIYLREMEMKNVQTTVSLNGSHVVLKPMKFALNGAPVDATADLDLSVPGYKYAVTFSANKVPFAPLVDTFAPDRKGQLGGTLTANAQLNGLGITGVNLQKHLTGQFDIGTTNLNLSIVNIHSPILKTIINAVGMIPELLHNPEGAIGSLLGGLTGNAAAHGSLTDELSKSPIDVITARGNAADGKVNLQQFVVRSPAFEADAKGDVVIAPILTNSAVQIPVTVSLSRSLAERVNLASANTATNAAYAKLPDFLTIKGTVGKPKSDINKAALVGTVLQSVTGFTGTNSKAGELIQGLGGILGGKKSGGTNAPSANTNPPAKNQSPIGNILNRFLKQKKK